MKFGMFYEVQVPRPAPPEAEHERLLEIIEQVVLAEEMTSLRLFGKYVITHFKEKERRAQAATAAADNG